MGTGMRTRDAESVSFSAFTAEMGVEGPRQLEAPRGSQRTVLSGAWRYRELLTPSPPSVRATGSRHLPSDPSPSMYWALPGASACAPFSEQRPGQQSQLGGVAHAQARQAAGRPPALPGFSGAGLCVLSRPAFQSPHLTRLAPPLISLLLPVLSC